MLLLLSNKEDECSFCFKHMQPVLDTPGRLAVASAWATAGLTPGELWAWQPFPGTQTGLRWAGGPLKAWFTVEELQETGAACAVSPRGQEDFMRGEAGVLAT